MTEKLAFELVETDDPDSYLIRMTNNGQVAELTHSEGFAKSFTIEPIRILYDEGNGEIVLAEGFEDRPHPDGSPCACWTRFTRRP